MVTTQDSPLLADVGIALGEWIGGIIPGIDLALAEIGQDDWAPGTREAVLRWASNEIVDQFIGEEWERSTGPEQLDREARLHLGRYVVARARAHVMRGQRGDA